MLKKAVVVLVIFMLFLAAGIGVYYAISCRLGGPIQKQGAITKLINDLWQKTKVYKNDYLGFSVDYPEDWFIRDHSKRHAVIDYQGGGLLLEIYNFNPQKQPNFPNDRKMVIDVDYLRDHFGNPQNIKERVLFLMDAQVKVDVKKIDEFNVSGGNGFLISCKARGGLFSKVGQDFNLGVFYLMYMGKNSLIYFIPYHIPSEKDYMNLLKAVKIY